MSILNTSRKRKSDAWNNPPVNPAVYDQVRSSVKGKLGGNIHVSLSICIYCPLLTGIFLYKGPSCVPAALTPELSVPGGCCEGCAVNGLLVVNMAALLVLQSLAKQLTEVKQLGVICY